MEQIIRKLYTESMFSEQNTEKLKIRISERVRSLRKSLDLTQEQLAEIAGIGPEHLSKIETAKRIPSLDALIGLASALKVEVADLIGRSDTPPDSDRAERLNTVLSKLCNEDADFLEAELLNWAARLQRIRG